MKIPIQKLTVGAFSKFGTYGSLLSIEEKALAGGGAIWFWPDVGGVLNLGPDCASQVAFGICRVAWRPLKIEVCEFHTGTGEGILPLDGDIYLHVGPPTGDDVVPLKALEVFRIPKGTIVVLKPGVWHHAPFAVRKNETVSSLIVLPQRTYANDCVVKKLAKPIVFG
jgi:ureidoglycolate lyase